jgi:hypothetical protein
MQEVGGWAFLGDCQEHCQEIPLYQVRGDDRG